MSKIPTTESFYDSIFWRYECPLSDSEKSLIIEAIRKAMTITRDVALEVAAEESEIVCNTESGGCSGCVNKESITSLKDHEDLKIE